MDSQSVVRILPDVMVDDIIATPIAQSHIIELPPMCPVSKNPKTGSYIKITYIATDKSLEVYSLQGYIDSFIGGKVWRGEHFIRDMEQTIRVIALDCAQVLDTAVTVYAYLLLDTHVMELTV